jgi:hypothetical protein
VLHHLPFHNSHGKLKNVSMEWRRNRISNLENALLNLGSVASPLLGVERCFARYLQANAVILQHTQFQP